MRAFKGKVQVYWPEVCGNSLTPTCQTTSPFRRLIALDSVYQMIKGLNCRWDPKKSSAHGAYMHWDCCCCLAAFKWVWRYCDNAHKSNLERDTIAPVMAPHGDLIEMGTHACP